MKEKLNIIKANIENLTTLWKTASVPFQSYFKTSFFDYCEIKDGDWPNRLWFNQDITQDAMEEAFNSLTSISTNLILPYWDIYNNKSYEYIEAMGGVKLFEQVGMSLKLNHQFKLQNELEFALVSEKSEAKLWTELYPKAFGYRISKDILVKTFKDIKYYLAYYHSQPIGTALLFNTKRISGIHGIGVIPEMRKKGFAEEITKFVINKSIDSNSEYVTLQASEMGKNLYYKLGFEEQFIIKNYTFKNVKS